MKKLLRRLLYLFLLAVVIGIVIYAWPRLPIITAFAAKGMCSCVFIADRDPESVANQDLSFFPISLARTKINYDDRSVTASLLGLAKRKAVYREGLGCAVVVDIPEEEIRKQSFTIPELLFEPETSSWPLGDMLPDTIIPGLNYNQLEQVVSGAFDEPGDEPYKKSQAMVVVYDNIIVAEKYLEGFDMYTECLGWSMAKSVTSSLVGILVKEGKLDIYKTTGIDEWQNDNRSTITVNNLLHMNSGLKWVENYFDLSEVTRMLYMRGDMFGYAIKSPLIYKPDSIFYYSSGTANIISGIIRKTIGDDHDYYSFPYVRLFNCVGMRNTLFEADPAGTFVSSSYCYATPRDWARFGVLYLNNGIFEGDTILPDWWVKYTTTPANGSSGIYGAQFWLHHEKKFPDVPEDMYFCDGFNGQRIFIIPSKKLVVVRMGYSMKNIDMNEFLRKIISTLPDGNLTTEDTEI
jgi:CubicO group peptidase (beta-lactamase class C family)